MSDAPRGEHIETWGVIATAAAGFFAVCRALLYRRKKQPPTLSEEVIARIRAEVVHALRNETQMAIGDLGVQMEGAVTFMKAAVMRIEQLVSEVPSLRERVSQLDANLSVMRRDIIEIQGELRRRQ